MRCGSISRISNPADPVPLPDPAELNRLAARARAHVGMFTLPLRDRNWRGNAGEFAGSGVGSSLDFQDHRSYVPGDDPRHINWQAYARSGHYSLKLYREEVRPVVEILLDVSESMFADEEKARRVVELFYFAFASAEQAGASTAVTLLKGPRWKALERGSVLGHGWAAIAAELPVTEAAAPPPLGEVPLRSRALRVLISDLLFPASPEPMLRGLVREFGRAIVLAPYIDAEATPDWSGNCEFVDTESGALHQRRVDPSLLRRYADAYRDHFSRWKAAALRNRTPLAKVPSAPRFEDAVKLEAIPGGVVLFT